MFANRLLHAAATGCGAAGFNCYTMILQDQHVLRGKEHSLEDMVNLSACTAIGTFAGALLSYHPFFAVSGALLGNRILPRYVSIFPELRLIPAEDHSKIQ
ncbi:MAG: hypothetical protein KDK72_07750 [Chlamydiia bacterium]|nr:hypothetical protein [Chlamydiia bacterium]